MNPHPTTFQLTHVASSHQRNGLGKRRPGEEPSIGVVICAYTEARWPELVEAVRSIVRQSRPARELVVVIDHNDLLLARARAAFPGARVIPSNGRPGLSGARNTGVSHIS